MRRYQKEVAAAARRGQPSAPARSRSSAAPSASSPSSPFFTGTEVGLQGYAALNQLGIAAFTGFISAYFNTREIAPLVAGLALSATVGCGFTAQLGAMRISEEVDALEVMGIPSPAVPGHHPDDRRLRRRHPALRRRPAVVATAATRLIATGYYGQSAGTYDHYFHLFLPPSDVLLVVRQGAGLRRRDHPDPLLLRLHAPAAARPASASPSAGRCAPSIVAINVVDFFLSPRHLGRDDDRADRGVSASCCMTQRHPAGSSARTCCCASRRRLPARARAAGRPHGRDLPQGVRRRRARHAARPTASATSSQPPADVKLRGLIVGEVRSVSSDGATAHRRPGAAPRARSAQIPRNVSARLLPKTLFGEKFVDLVHPGAAVRAAARPRATSSRRTAVEHGHRAREGPRRPPAAAAHRPAGQAQRDAQRARDRARGPRRPARREPRAGRPLLHRAQPAACRPSRRTSRGLADVERDLRRRRPRPGPDAAQPLGHDGDDRREAERRTPASSPAPPASPRRRAAARGQRGPHHPARPRSAGRRCAAGQVLARVPLPAAGPGRVERLHRQVLRQRRAAHHARGGPGPAQPYKPGEEPQFSDEPRTRTAAACRTARRRPDPGQPLRRRHRRRQQRRRRAAASCSTRDRPGSAGTAEEQRVVDALARAGDGRAAPTRCPTSRRCSSARWPAGRWWGSREDHALARSSSSCSSSSRCCATGTLAATIGNFRFGGTRAYRRCSPTSPACRRATTSASPASGSARSPRSRVAERGGPTRSASSPSRSTSLATSPSAPGC